MNLVDLTVLKCEGEGSVNAHRPCRCGTAAGRHFSLLIGSPSVADGSTTSISLSTHSVYVGRWIPERQLGFVRAESLHSSGVLDLRTSDSFVNAPCRCFCEYVQARSMPCRIRRWEELDFRCQLQRAANCIEGAGSDCGSVAFLTCGACKNFQRTHAHIGGATNNSSARWGTFGGVYANLSIRVVCRAIANFDWRCHGLAR
jgi:hypothetical protein